MGVYLRNQKEINLLADDAHLPVGSISSDGNFTFRPDQLMVGSDGKPVMVNGQYVPKDYALLPKEAMTVDERNLGIVQVGLTQPIYMGGKIRAYNQIAGLSERLAKSKRSQELQNVILSTDEAYWQIISLVNRKKLADKYVETLTKFVHDVELMHVTGVHYLDRFAETLIATHADLAARQLDPPAPAALARERRHRIHDQMEREGQASARITLKTSVGMSDEAFAAALAKAKAEGRESVHVRAWLSIPAECLAQSEIELQSFTEQPGRIADANAPQRTVCWEADLTENRRFGVQYRYKTTAVYADPLDFVPAPEQPTFDTEEQAPHIVFTPYLRALAAQLTEGITDPAEKAKRIYDYVTLNVRYHYQPAYFVQDCLPDRCARDRRGDCGIMALTFITLCRLVGIPARWQSGLSVSPTGVGCHDWAMFYIAPKGWMYADCSFGASMARQGEEELRRHYFGSLDTGRMVANRAFEAPFDPPMYGFRSDPYDNQSGECEVDGVGLYGDALDTRKELVDFEDL